MNTQKAKRSSMMNQFSIKLPETGEELGDLMGLAMMDVLKTEDECIRAVNRIGDIIIGKYLTKDYEDT
jgi:hypothetical protein